MTKQGTWAVLYCNTATAAGGTGVGRWAGAGRAQQEAGRAGVQARGARALGRGAQRARGRALQAAAGSRQGRAGWPRLCTRCTRPVFGPV